MFVCISCSSCVLKSMWQPQSVVYPLTFSAVLQCFIYGSDTHTNTNRTPLGSSIVTCSVSLPLAPLYVSLFCSAAVCLVEKSIDL